MFQGKKTYIIAIVTTVTAIGAYLTGDATLAQTIQIVVTAVIGATLKHGQQTGK